jgi:hypothetical protein
VQRKTSRRCAATCGTGRRRTRVAIARTEMSPHRGRRTLWTERDFSYARVVACAVLCPTLHREYGQYSTPHSLDALLCFRPWRAGALPTYESDTGTFDSEELYPIYRTYLETLR